MRSLREGLAAKSMEAIAAVHQRCPNRLVLAAKVKHD